MIRLQSNANKEEGGKKDEGAEGILCQHREIPLSNTVKGYNLVQNTHNHGFQDLDSQFSPL